MRKRAAVQAVARSTSHEGEAARAVRRRTGTTATVTWLDAAAQESVLQIWKARKAAAREEIANAERVAKAIHTLFP